MTDNKKKWSSQNQGFNDSLKYMQGRMKGEIRSLKTPWPKFNDAGVEGLEWSSTTVIGGRPGSLKTLIKDQIVRESFIHNAGDDFRVLEFQLEMLARTSAIREYSSILGKSYKHLCSAGEILKPEELMKCYEYAKERVKYPIDVVEEACTVPEFIQIIKEYMEEHAILEPVKQYRKTLITLDHSLLLKKAPYEKDKYDMLYALGEAVTMLKRKYPIAFLILSQLNRGIDSIDRNAPGTYGNYPNESDLFGADALLQHADLIVLLNRPAKQKINIYGPEKFIIDDESLLAAHFVKCRNGDTRISFFRAEFNKMKINECMTPGVQARRSIST